MGTYQALIREDTSIDSQNTGTNMSTSSDLMIGAYFGGSGSYRRLTLMRLDLRPFTEAVTLAELKLYERINNGHGAVTLNIRKCLKPYVNTQATWNQYATGMTWDRDIAGDDFSSSVGASLAITDSIGYKTIDMTTLVNAERGTLLAVGIGFSGASASQNTMVNNSTRATTNRPYLEITTTQADWVFSGSASPMVMG